MSQSQQQSRHSPSSGSSPQITIPQFHPLPDDTFLNRIINRLLAPIFYLLFTIVTSIIVVPIYTIIENFKHGATKTHRKPTRRSHNTSSSIGRDYSHEATLAGGRDKGAGGGTLGDYLREWGKTYEGSGSGNGNGKAE